MSVFLEYLSLYWVFVRIGAVTFGGGLAMLPILERDLIKKRQWMTGEQLLDYFAIGQVTPGIVAVNVSTFVGYNRKGFFGALVATAGIVTPSLIIITFLAMFLSNFADILWVQHALRGINVVVAMLLIDALVRMARKTIIDWVTAAIVVASFIAIMAFDVSGVWVVLGSAALGIALKYRPGKAAKGEDQ